MPADNEEAGVVYPISPSRFRQLIEASREKLRDEDGLFSGMGAPPAAYSTLVTRLEEGSDVIGREGLGAAALLIGFEFGKEFQRLEDGGEPIDEPDVLDTLVSTLRKFGIVIGGIVVGAADDEDHDVEDVDTDAADAADDPLEDPEALRQEALRVIGEDRISVDTLREVVAQGTSGEDDEVRPD